MPGQSIRKPGGGRKKTVNQDPTLQEDLNALVNPATCGDPESPLRWTCKSVRQLAAELRAMGHETSHRLVAALLHEMGYSLQANRKVREGVDHPDRDVQFWSINNQMQKALAAGEPAISVDTKKKELVGDFKNAGREWRPKGQPEVVRVHDFKIKELGRLAPDGVLVKTSAGLALEPTMTQRSLLWPPFATGGGAWDARFILGLATS